MSDGSNGFRNALTSAVHDRMPVILRKDDYDVWLDPGMTDVRVEIAEVQHRLFA
jgi:putative SOS response-associated peptidase YedK